jgi:protein-arginine kinase
VHKYKSGDIVATEHPDKWPIVLEILRLIPSNGFTNHTYEVRVLDTTREYKHRIGEIDHFNQSAIDTHWKYAKVFTAIKQFDNDLENLLKE